MQLRQESRVFLARPRPAAAGLLARMELGSSPIGGMEDTRRRSSANRIHEALRALGKDLVVETRAALNVVDLSGQV